MFIIQSGLEVMLSLEFHDGLRRESRVLVLLFRNLVVVVGRGICLCYELLSALRVVVNVKSYWTTFWIIRVKH